MFKAIKKCRENLLHYAFLRKKTDMKVERSMITRAIFGSESRSQQRPQYLRTEPPPCQLSSHKL